MRRTSSLTRALLFVVFLSRRGRHFFVVVQFLLVHFVTGRIYARKRDQSFDGIDGLVEIELRCVFVPYIDYILVASTIERSDEENWIWCKLLRERT